MHISSISKVEGLADRAPLAALFHQGTKTPGSAAYRDNLALFGSQAPRLLSDETYSELQQLDRASALNDQALVLAVRNLSSDQLGQVAKSTALLLRLHDMNRLTFKDDRPPSIRETLQHYEASPAGAEKFRHDIQRANVCPVFTAHPSEIVPRDVAVKLRDIANLLIGKHLSPPKAKSAKRTFNELIFSRLCELRNLDTVRAERPTPQEEAAHVADLLTSSVLPLLVKHYEAVQAEARDRFGNAAPEIPIYMRLHSWVGGDRDGNPNVTAVVTKRIAADMRERILGLYTNDLADIRKQVESTVHDFPNTAENTGKLIHKIDNRLLATRNDRTALNGPQAYPNASELRRDLAVLEGRLRSGGNVDGANLVNRLARKSKIAGFHLATLEWRQDSGRVISAYEQLIDLKAAEKVGAAEFEHLGPDERAALQDATMADSTPLITRARIEQLEKRAKDPTSSQRQATHDALEFIDSLQALKDIRESNGAEAIGGLILANSEHPAEILALTHLAREAGVYEKGALSSVPLFESIEALEKASVIVRQLLENTDFREHIRRSGNVWEIMIGYSDSAKVGGRFAADIAIEHALRGIAQVLKEFGVTPLFFHGRGGSDGRGRAGTLQAVRTEPPGLTPGSMKYTEQGENLRQRYGNELVAKYTFDDAFAAALASSRGVPRDVRAEDEAVKQRLSEESHAAYRTLLQRDDFARHFQTLTPFDLISGLPTSSRPAKRSGSGGDLQIDGVRAVPWTFAWSQVRSHMPSWYGIGTALHDFANRDADGLEQLRALYAHDTTFKTRIDKTKEILEQTHGETLRRNAGTSNEAHLMVDQIENEYERTARMVEAVTSRPIASIHSDESLGGTKTASNPTAAKPQVLLDIAVAVQQELAQRLRNPVATETPRTLGNIAIAAVAAGIGFTG